ncbi:hypothetical protein AB0C50_12460 [Micromonospora taraxaci]|uniref:hypothetical protein n=1 Tax=Micromonospora taraxaci TaxID=1316803 RepID=UPI0033C550DD
MLMLEIVVESLVTGRGRVPAGSLPDVRLDKCLEPDAPSAVGSRSGEVDRPDRDGAMTGGVLPLNLNIADINTARATQQPGQPTQHVRRVKKVFRFVRLLRRWLLGGFLRRARLILAIDGIPDC